MPESPRLILFPGLGADNRLMRSIRPHGARTVARDHLAPLRGETLPDYARRVAEDARIVPSDVVGGASFGGMLAAEIARQRTVAGLVLLGTCVRPGRHSLIMKALYAARGIIPDAALRLRGWGPLLRWRFAPIDGASLGLIREMVSQCPPDQIRCFGQMAMEWAGAPPVGRVLSVHGDRDKVIPLTAAEPGIVLPGAGHAFTLTHPAETNASIEAFLASLPVAES